MSESPALQHPPFVSGELVTPEDLARHAHYFREKFKRHNRSLHGFGVVSGLKVTVKSGRINLEPGLALDCEGNELVIDNEQWIALPSNCDWGTAFVNVHFVEDRAGSAFPEGFELDIAQENYNRGHRHQAARWLACARSHALTIARLKSNRQAWRVDRSYRPPQVK